jgi:hypothetical protein
MIDHRAVIATEAPSVVERPGADAFLASLDNAGPYRLQRPADLGGESEPRHAR